MYKVMVVEDELLVRLGLINSIDWSKFGMAVVADAADGKAAWELYTKEKPDVVITDLRMPRMDGITLITKIREKDKTTRVIVLSCLEEFDLARKAMSLGVSDYILKLTMTEEEMEDVLRKTYDELSQNTVPEDSRSTTIAAVETGLVKEKMLKDFLFYNVYSVDEFTDFVERSGLRLSETRLVLCTIEIDHYQVLCNKFQDEQGHLIKVTLLNILEEIMAIYRRGEAFYLDETHYTAIFSFADITSEQAITQQLYGILGKIREVIGTYFGGSVTFGLSGVQSGYRSLPSLYTESRQALNKKYYVGSGLILTGDTRFSETKLRERIEELKHIPFLGQLFGERHAAEYARRIDRLAEALFAGKETVLILFNQLLQWVASALLYKDEACTQALMDYSRKLNNCETMMEMTDAFTMYLNDIVDIVRKRRLLSKEIAHAIQYIERNYDEDLSLQQVADHVSLSFSYLSNLFKKELQITFVEYLNNFRIERAKELLTGTPLKTYEIAQKVGFSPESTYFSKVFKKTTGLSPNEFRRQRQTEFE
ncbi:response regulator [Paenibacillus yanchengensis]|uniref:Response regulator n=1 Tax=Paenibacillus yanchengensis TaxID=2035833 RepID=A0ABW4YQE8_9BACL